jgi:predicted Zn-dependent protease
MQIANIYYQRKDYNDAIRWSKKANEKNPEKYESWYLFAKSLLKQGKKEEAKKVLIAYLNTYANNDKIIELLRSIR